MNLVVAADVHRRDDDETVAMGWRSRAKLVVFHLICALLIVFGGTMGIAVIIRYVYIAVRQSYWYLKKKIEEGLDDPESNLKMVSRWSTNRSVPWTKYIAMTRVS